MNDISNHLYQCLYESKECPFRKLSDVDCSWTGTVSDIAAHVSSGHSSEDVQDVRHFKVKLLDISTETRYWQAVLILGELFYLTWKTGSDAPATLYPWESPHNQTRYRRNKLDWSVSAVQHNYLVEIICMYIITQRTATCFGA